MKRHGYNPENTSNDLESPHGQNKFVSMAPPNIQPYQAYGGGGGGGQDERKVHGRPGGKLDPESMKKVAAAVAGIWLLGVFVGYDYMWPLYLVVDLLGGLFSYPPLSWLLSPFSWIFSWMNRGAPVVQQMGGAQEMRLPTDQVPGYLDQYVQHYGDAALIFATHDGYPQIVNALLYNQDLGYADLIDATDENGNTALIYASAKGFRQSTAALLRSGADPDVANQGHGGRTPLVEAAGAGHKDLVAALRLTNATVDAVDDYGNTALHYAAYHGHLSCVHELLKANPRKDIQNSYGHTAASYAASNKFKAIADVLSRAPSKRELAQRAAEEKQKSKSLFKADEDAEATEDEDDPLKELAELVKGGKKKDAAKSKSKSEPKRVHGGAEELHEKEDSFAPKLEKDGGALSSKERKSLEEQITKLKRRHEDAELKAQKRLVELLETSSGHQQEIDEAQRAVRNFQLNLTELSFKVQELQTKHLSSEQRAQEEKDRADRLQQEMAEAELEAARYKLLAEGAEKDRVLQEEAAKRQEERLKNKREEVNEHLGRLERQQQEMSSLRGDVKKQQEALQQHREESQKLQRELALLKGEEPRAAPAVVETRPPAKEAPSEPAASPAAPAEEAPKAEPVPSPGDAAKPAEQTATEEPAATEAPSAAPTEAPGSS